MYGCESWTVKKAERWRIDAFELWCWWRLLRVPWTARRSNQSILKEINHEYSGLISFMIGWFWSPCCPRDSQESAPAPQFESINSLALSLLYVPTHLYMTTEKTIALIIQIFVSKVISLLFNMLSRFCHSFCFKEQVSFHGFSHCPQWFLEPKKMNSATISIFPHLFAMKQWDRMPWS